MKIVHNTDTSFAKEAVKSSRPVRIGMRKKENDGIVSFFLVATAIVGDELHETSMLFDLLSPSMARHESSEPRIMGKFERLAKRLKAFLEDRGVKEVEIESYYSHPEEETPPQ